MVAGLGPHANGCSSRKRNGGASSPIVGQDGVGRQNFRGAGKRAPDLERTALAAGVVGQGRTHENSRAAESQEEGGKTGDGRRDSHQQGSIVTVVEKEKPVIMATAANVAKRIPLIRFPNRKAGEGPVSHAVSGTKSRPSAGEGQSQAMSLPCGTATSQPPRTRLSEEEIEAILLGGAAP